ncbi:hypothetical protein P775_03285 [Puniceibacterium antarcticum]|uniref:B12-binding domain-containing protein n=1 Tax=Puniceibacterium antarcticum TaxID=1206336 RepID=A0A2G8RJF3_9RHOB|nr:cobalamin B12-binding domain-containing protein [Puniceibacterium antarcticum]PIL21699.1 hypothetical protein P775_03285 [Puniceibacterium antarcticum]
MPYAEDERHLIDSWTQYIHVEDMRTLAQEALRRVAARSTLVQSRPEIPEPDPATLTGLCDTLVGPNFEAAEDVVIALLRQGVTLESIYHDYLGRAAAQLGEMWDEDRLSFVDVTRGVSRIIVLMRTLRDRADLPRITHAAPILLAAVPGETHALGVTMARDLLRDRGWDVNLLLGLDHDALVEKISKADARLLGLSCSGAATASALARVILAVRMVRPTLPILVSGQFAVTHTDLLAAIAPDSVVTTIDEAVSEIERLTGPASNDNISRPDPTSPWANRP